MITPQLLEYIKSQLQQRKDQRLIKGTLLISGWTENDISQAFAILIANPPPSPPAEQPTTGPQTVSEEPIILVPRMSPISQAPPLEQLAPKETLAQVDYEMVSTLEDSSIILEEDGRSEKKWLWALMGTLVLIVAFMGSFFYYLGEQRSGVQNLVKKQTDSFSRLELIYASLAKTFQEGPIEDKGTQNEASLLKFSLSPNVLGLENESPIATLRKLGELYEQGDKQAKEIASLNNQIEEKIKTVPLNSFLPESGSLFLKTKEFTDNDRLLFDYLKRKNRLDLKNFTSLMGIEGALANIGLKGVDKSSLGQLEEKLKSVDEMQQQYSALDISPLPKEIKQWHQQEIEDLPKVRTAFKGIYEALRSGDSQGTTNALTNFKIVMVESTIGSEIARVEIISFWQDKQREPIEEIKNEWEKFDQKVSSRDVMQSLIMILSP